MLRCRRRSKKNLSVRSRDGCSEERDFGLKWIYGERERVAPSGYSPRRIKNEQSPFVSPPPSSAPYFCPLSHAGDPISGACLPNIEGVAAGREGETCHTLIIFRAKFSTPSDLPTYLDAILCARRRNRRIVPENEAKGWLGWLHPLSSFPPCFGRPSFFFRRCHPAQKKQLLFVLSLFFLSFLHPPPPPISIWGWQTRQKN